MKLTITLVSWNGERFLQDNLDSLGRQSFSDYRLLVLDNGSEDNSVELVREWLQRHQGELREGATNIGFSRGYNELIKEVTTPYVMVLNQDVILEPNYLEELVCYLDKNLDVASVSGLLLRMDYKNGYLKKTDRVDNAGLVIFPTHKVVEKQRGVAMTEISKQSEYVFGVPATAVIYRRDVLESVGLKRKRSVEYFDESFFAYKEDVDLAYRLQLSGHESAMVPTALAYHLRSMRGEVFTDTAFGSIANLKNRRSQTVFDRRQSYHNHLLFLFSSFAFPVWSKEWWMTLWYEIGKFIILIFTEPRTLFAWFDIIRKWTELRSKRRQVYQEPFNAFRVRRWWIKI